MIDSLKVKNFKCFENMEIEFSNLNVFAGVNSMGKSTLIQALLLLRQAYDADAITKGLHLNGTIVNVGVGFDLLYRNSESDEIEIDLTQENKVFRWLYEYNQNSDFLKLKSDEIADSLETLNLFLPTFSYISADRIAPQRIYKKSYHEVYEKNQIGYRGELFADYLAERALKDKVENPSVLHPNQPSSVLLYQTDAWLSEISPGISLDTKKYTEAGLVAMEFQVLDAESRNTFSPLNVGFGISYVLPIVVAILKAKVGDLVILENPEAHLHPKGQRKMGELIAKACAGGVQIIVETHSDHLLNGIRLSVKSQHINSNLVRLNYFYQNAAGLHEKVCPMILQDGSLSSWPDGFFDEWDKAIDELF